MPSVYIKTYGCQMNERDSEAVAAQLVARGYSLAESEDTADIILLNTCSVRDLAEQKALGKMRALSAEVRRSKRNVVLGFMGCMAQARGESLIERLPDVDLIVGTQKFHHVADYIDDLLSGRRERIIDVNEEKDSQMAIREHLLDGLGQKAISAFVSIMQGCNQRCSFCIVPYTRGKERCRPIENIVQECRELAAKGVKEITLLGQIVTSYGRGEIPEKDGKSPFVQLLEAVHQVDGVERIRFTAPHPKGYGDDLVEAYGRLPKLVESAHIPVQSGSNRILELMKRGHTREKYISIIDKLRAVKPDIGICTDIIVGFPGETDEDFNQTKLLIEEVQFDQAFIFKYSPRQGTKAADMPDQVPQAVKEERHRILLDLMNRIGFQRYSRYIGREVEILVEGPSRKNPNRLSGRTRCNKIVVYDGKQEDVGSLLKINITRAGTFTLYGEPIY
ncbi:MAG: tRNA (N6-isopentenyl adenosine(37)-C2)-methylthiotransferase MiaB [Verrucomicrobiae bacterium]|nr:tRNA (N6-isopentenyl adenosine(37)-C2)-methylthiotransferase MiaB [Verrucomicrobiae bacterium]